MQVFVAIVSPPGFQADSDKGVNATGIWLVEVYFYFSFPFNSSNS